MSGNVFAGDQVLPDAGFDAARCRLQRLASDGVLLGASGYTYGAAITGLAETAGMSRLAGVRPGDLTERGGRSRPWPRWEATGPWRDLPSPCASPSMRGKLRQRDLAGLSAATKQTQGPFRTEVPSQKEDK
jgi:hypothetical protein